MSPEAQSTPPVESRILAAIQLLPADLQQQVLDFVEFLVFRFQGAQGQKDLAEEGLSTTGEVPEAEQPVSTPSFLEVTQSFAGCLDGGPTDLSVNKQYLEGLGAE